MNQAFKYTAATLVGIATAIAVISLVEFINGKLFPVPPGMDFLNKELVVAYMAQVPAASLMLVLLGWLLGVFCGSVIAHSFVHARPVLWPALVGGFVLLATALNLYMLPHPLWFSVLSIVAILAVTVMTALWLGRRHDTQPKTAP